MRPTTALLDNIVDLDALLHPGIVFRTSPGRGLRSDPQSFREARRPGVMGFRRFRDRVVPSLRAPDGLKAPVTIDEIL